MKNDKNIKDFTDLFEKIGVDYDLTSSKDGSYLELNTLTDGINSYIIFINKNGEYYAYNLNTDFVPSGLYGDAPDEFLEKRHKNIYENIQRIYSGQLSYERAPTIFNKNKGYIRLNVDGHEVRIKQKANIYNLPE